MPTGTGTKKDQTNKEFDDIINANYGDSDFEHKLASHDVDEEQQYYDREFKDITDSTYDDEFKRIADEEAPKGEQAVASKARSPQNTMNYKPSESSGGGDDKNNFLGRFKKNRKMMAAGGIGLGLVGVLLAAFIALIPFKLETILKNITTRAAGVPEHIIENRMNYLMAYYLANKMSPNIIDGKDVVQGNTVAAILFLNWQASRIESRMGLAIETLERDGATGKATKWKLTPKSGESVTFSNGNTYDLTREIQSNREIREYIRRELRNTTKSRNVYKRYVGRKVLMNKYGVRSWRGPAKIENALDNYQRKKIQAKRAIKKRLVNATVGRIAPNYGRYLSCMIEGGEKCDELRDPNNSTAVEPPAPDIPDDDALEDEARANLGEDATDQEIQDEVDRLRTEYGAGGNALNDGADIDVDEISDDVIGDGDSDVGGEASKLFTKELVKRIAVGGAMGLGIIEFLSNMVDAVNEGRVNSINYEMYSQAYAGFSTEFATMNDKEKAGDLDLANMGAIMETLDRIEESPLEQRELGSLRSDPDARPVYRDCDDDGKKEELPKGQIVCDDKVIGKDATGLITREPYKDYWDGISKVNEYYKSSVGSVVKFFTDIIGKISDATIGPLIEKLTEITGLKGLMEKMVNWAMGLLFTPPVNGLEEKGDAYDAISAGTRVTYNGTMEMGRDADGKAMGGGGHYLTNEQAVVLQSEVDKERHQEFMEHNVFARIFNPNLSGSIMEGLVMKTPTNIASILGSPVTTLSKLMVPRVNAADSSMINPFNSMINGYTDADGYADADPVKYTQEFCDKSAEDRKNSYTRDAIKNNGTDYDTPVPVATKADPCALEAMVANIGLATSNTEANSDYELEGEGTGAVGNDDGAEVPSGSFGWPLSKEVLDSVTIGNCWRSSASGSGHTGLDFAVPIGTPVKAANSGKVVMAGGGGDAGNVVMIKHTDGHWTNYQHLSKIGVKVGQNVKTGDVIGQSGNTGFSTGPHLHFSVTTAETLGSRRNTAGTINPLPLMPKTGGPKVAC